MITAGIDIGSVATKVVILEETKLLAKAFVLTGAQPHIAAEKTFKEALRQAGLLRQDVGYIVSTGYGRRTIDFGDQVVTEITAAAKGASFLGSPLGRIQTVIDLGGQDSKVISLDEEGRVLDFVMNDRCSAGTGRFLEVMSNVLEVSLEDLGNLSLKSSSPINISSICTVFAESEVISLIAQNRNREDIIAGICLSISERLCGLISQVGAREVISFIGGGAKNAGIKKTTEDKLKKKVWVPDEPQFVVALGSALIAQDIR